MKTQKPIRFLSTLGQSCCPSKCCWMSVQSHSIPQSCVLQPCSAYRPGHGSILWLTCLLQKPCRKESSRFLTASNGAHLFTYRTSPRRLSKYFLLHLSLLAERSSTLEMTT